MDGHLGIYGCVFVRFVPCDIRRLEEAKFRIGSQMGLSLSLYTHVLEGEIINEHKVVGSTQRKINKIGEHFVSGCWDKKRRKHSGRLCQILG